MRRFSLVLLFASLSACGGTDNKFALNVPQRNGAQCNPISLGECLLPIPSSVWQKNDSSTATGYRLALPAKLLPAKMSSKKGASPVPLDPAPYNAADGWSPGTSIFLHSAEALDASNLPPHEDIAASLKDGSPTILIDAETGERVAHWAELDQNDAKGGSEYKDHGLLIRPASDLKRSHRYIVAITKGLKTKSGAVIPVPRAFTALRNDEETDNEAVNQLRPRYRSLFAILDKAGIDANGLLIAWDFDTASDEYLHRDILAMQKQAVKALGTDGIGYTIDSIEAPNADHPNIWKVKGTYKSPLFLENKGDPYDRITKCKNEVFGDCPPAGYVRDANGLPKQDGTWDRPFVMTIPTSVTQGTLKAIQFGHGLLGGGDEIFSGYNRGFAIDRKIVFLAHNWTGLCEEDVPIVSAGLLNWNLFANTAYRLGQGHIDAIALSYTAHRIAGDASLKTALGIAFNPFQTDDLTYYGISLGGIMGGGFMALHPFITKGVLNVAGSTWSVMIQRSSNWNTYGAGLATGYPSYLDAQILLTLSQTLWDISDPIAFAPHLIANPFPDVPVKTILYQEAVNDTQVPNVASEKMVRAAGLKLITPSVREVFGVETATEATSGFSIWDESPEPTPRVNVPPSEDNGTHGSIRKLTALKAQIDRFLWGDGLVVNTCDGPCDPE